MRAPLYLRFLYRVGAFTLELAPDGQLRTRRNGLLVIPTFRDLLPGDGHGPLHGSGWFVISLYMSNVPEVGFYSGFVRVIYVFLGLYFWVF